MSDYSPDSLSSRWTRPLSTLAAECQYLWDAGRPKTSWLGTQEKDSSQDGMTPKKDRQKLLDHGLVVMGHFARAFFPAYVPGRNTHYGSVVYAIDPESADEVFELAWKVNELRNDDSTPPKGTEIVAQAIRDDRSNFARIEMPPELGVGPGRFFANICIHRTRLPVGYLHNRVVPLLIAPKKSEWCCLLPLRYWSHDLISIWQEGEPCYPTEQFLARCRLHKIDP